MPPRFSLCWLGTKTFRWLPSNSPRDFSIPLDRALADVASVFETISALRPVRGSQVRALTLAGAVKSLRQWWSMPLLLQVAVAKAAGMVLFIEIGLRSTDIERLSALLRVPLSSGLLEAPDADARVVELLSDNEQRAYWATGWVLDRWLFDGTCLRRSLATGYFLRRHHPILRLGLVGDGRSSHAWIEAEGVAFNQTEVTGAFTGPVA